MNNKTQSQIPFTGDEVGAFQVVAWNPRTNQWHCDSEHYFLIDALNSLRYLAMEGRIGFIHGYDDQHSPEDFPEQPLV